MPIQTPFDTGWLCLLYILLFIYYILHKLQLLITVIDHFVTVGLHRTFDIIHFVSQAFRWPTSFPLTCPHVRTKPRSCGMGRHRWKLRACKRSNFNRRNCSSGCHGRNRLHPFRTRPSIKRRQPKHFRAARHLWTGQHEADPHGWKW